MRFGISVRLLIKIHERLGHMKMQTTLDVYFYLYTGRNDSVATLLDTIMNYLFVYHEKQTTPLKPINTSFAGALVIIQTQWY